MGSENPNGNWKWGIGDWFIEEIFTTPELAKNFRMIGSVRFVFPTSGGSPFGSKQYQWAPMIGASYAIPEHRVTISPSARYFMSYHATEPNTAQVRNLDLFPGVTFGLAEGWSLAFYSENPITYNDITNKWFVPIDVILIRRLSKTVEFAFGGAYGLGQGQSGLRLCHQRPADVLLLIRRLQLLPGATASRALRAASPASSVNR